ncbi:phosphatidate cytidylyltransferase [Sphingomonas bacterium]|uniref:phosphatidate cytidylyltransferase n=1 Tax=Sphingomonas bacterium TaxID=1895847 RepID=UPI0015772EAF|nr:phosphatidate cytidylyltransferase [Sphingomonas bacterium]
MTSRSRSGSQSDLGRRIVTGAALAAVAIVALIAGGVPFWLLAVIAALLMMAEWAELHAATPRQKRQAQFALSVPLAIMAPASLILETRNFFVLGLLAGAAFFTVIVTRRRELALGVLYCGLPVLALTLIRRQHAPGAIGGDWGLVWAIWAMALVWMTDIGAYATGRALGGRRLAPAISPGKTWAGLAGGVVLASLFGAFMHRAYGLPLRLTVATPALAVLAQAGDLYESWLKRRAGVKDSGHLLPGHGGVMDRLDGLVPVAPAAALLAVLPTLLHFTASWHR